LPLRQQMAAGAAAELADARLAVARTPAGATLRIPRPALSARVLSESSLSAMQLACGGEARVSLAAELAADLRIEAVDEARLECAVLAVLAHIASEGGEVLVEVRWLLRGSKPRAAELCDAWLRAVDACREAIPLRGCGVELVRDRSCIALTLNSDGWEEGEAAGGAVPLAAGWLLSHVRYASAPRVASRPLSSSERAMLSPAAAWKLAQQARCHVMRLPGAEATTRLVLCGPPSSVRRGLALLRRWEEERGW